MSVIEFSTPYMGIVMMILLVGSMIYVCESWVLRSIIKEHNLEYELDKFEGFLYLQTAIALTAWTFLICSLVDVITHKSDIFLHALIGTLIGICVGIVISYLVGRNAGRKLNK